MQNNKTLKLIIVIICFIVPALVAVLYILPSDVKLLGWDTSLLPKLNAVINSLTSLLLVFALVAIKNKNVKLHKGLMFIALGLGAVFLVSYVIYHATTMPAMYGDLDFNGKLSAAELSLIERSQLFYRVLLISHILLSIIVLPFVLSAVYFGLTENNSKHKNIVRFAFPIWLYVSITGVIVYFMISPYYA